MRRDEERLLFELMDLARAQCSALHEGKLDVALAMMERRKVIRKEIRAIDGTAHGDGVAGPRRSAIIKEILSIDSEISETVRGGMFEVAARLGNIEKLRILTGNVSFARGGAVLT